MRNTWLVGGIAGVVVAIVLVRASSKGVAADAPVPVQKWEYATFAERVTDANYFSWHSPRAAVVWDDNFPDFYRKMGGKGDATMAGNAELYNLVGAEGWEYVGVEDSLAGHKFRLRVFKRPLR
jgi:hypothetical protein